MNKTECSNRNWDMKQDTDDATSAASLAHSLVIITISISRPHYYHYHHHCQHIRRSAAATSNEIRFVSEPVIIYNTMNLSSFSWVLRTFTPTWQQTPADSHANANELCATLYIHMYCTVPSSWGDKKMPQSHFSYFTYFLKFFHKPGIYYSNFLGLHIRRNSKTNKL